MSAKKDQLFEKLLSEFMEISDDIEAVIISDQYGSIINGKKREKTKKIFLILNSKLITADCKLRFI